MSPHDRTEQRWLQDAPFFYDRARCFARASGPGDLAPALVFSARG